jgi:hypothetical protein
MCKDTISVRWDGALYDCDFNQQLEMDVAGPKKTLKAIDCVEDLTGNPIFADSHCFGCTAGTGAFVGVTIVSHVCWCRCETVSHEC